MIRSATSCPRDLPAGPVLTARVLVGCMSSQIDFASFGFINDTNLRIRWSIFIFNSRLRNTQLFHFDENTCKLTQRLIRCIMIVMTWCLVRVFLFFILKVQSAELIGHYFIDIDIVFDIILLTLTLILTLFYWFISVNENFYR